MSAVLIDNDRVEIPEGWCVVTRGVVRVGDRVFAYFDGGRWSDADDSHIADPISHFFCVIRRDPKETP